MDSCKHCEEGGRDCQGCQSQPYSCCECLEEREGKAETCEKSTPVGPREVATTETEGAREREGSAASDELTEVVAADSEVVPESDNPAAQTQLSEATGEESEGEEEYGSEGPERSYCSLCWERCWETGSNSKCPSTQQESPAHSGDDEEDGDNEEDGDDEEDGSEGSERSYCGLCWSKCWETGSPCDKISSLVRDQEPPAADGESDSDSASESDSDPAPDFDGLSCCSSCTEVPNGTEHYTDDQLFFLAKGKDDFVLETKKLVDRAKGMVHKLGIEIEWESNADLALILNASFVSTYNCRIYLDAHCKKVSEFFVHVMAHLARRKYHTLGGFICREKCILILPRQLNWGCRPQRRHLSSRYGKHLYVLSPSGSRSFP